MNTVKIALLGAGTVGSGVIRTLSMNGETIAGRCGARIEIKKILVRDAKKYRPEAEGITLTDNFEEILNDPEISIVVEVMGGLMPAKDYMLRAMRAGKHVVTANKKLLAEYGNELPNICGNYMVQRMSITSISSMRAVSAAASRSSSR